MLYGGGRGSFTIIPPSHCPALTSPALSLLPLPCLCRLVRCRYGVEQGAHTTFVNAASCTLTGRAVHPPIVLDVFSPTFHLQQKKKR